MNTVVQIQKQVATDVELGPYPMVSVCAFFLAGVGGADDKDDRQGQKRGLEEDEEDAGSSF